MEGVDPTTLLEWLQTGNGDERDLQLMALEQLCMLLLMSDNIDRCFEMCPPRSFLPALGKIFIDPTSPENILEVTARAITYYLDVSNECTKRLTQVEGSIRAICNRLAGVDMSERTSKDLAEQCVKLLEHVCQRESTAVYEAGGLQSMLRFIVSHNKTVHKDTMHSAMTVVTRLCSKVEPADGDLISCSPDLGALLEHDDEKISECALRCFAALVDRFIRKSVDPIGLATASHLVERLFASLSVSPDRGLTVAKCDERRAGGASEETIAPAQLQRGTSFVSIVLSLLSNLCRGSAAITDQILNSPRMVPAISAVVESRDERCVMDGLRLCDVMVLLLCEGRDSLGDNRSISRVRDEPIQAGGFDKAHRHLIDAIRHQDTDALIEAVENETIDVNFIDDVGQTLLNWCSAFGSLDMVLYLLDKGADPNRGQRSSSLHYAATFGRSEIVRALLRYGANPDLHDDEGKTPLDKARERSDENRQSVVQILESPASYSLLLSDDAKPKVLSEPWRLQSPTKEAINPPKLLMGLAEIKSIIRQLVPVFCTVSQRTCNGSIRRSALSLSRRCIAFMLLRKGGKDTSAQGEEGKSTSEERSGELSEEPMTAMVACMIVSVLTQGDDTETQEHALSIMKYLLDHDASFWQEQFVRLGISEKIETLAGEPADGNVPVTYFEGNSATLRKQEQDGASIDSEETSVSTTSDLPCTSSYGSGQIISTAASPSKASSQFIPADLADVASTVAQALGVQIVDDPEESPSSTASSSTRRSLLPSSSKRRSGLEETCQKLLPGSLYKWNDWRILRSLDSTFLWCDAIAIELSDASNGWLRFLMDGRLNTMYSNGTPDTGMDNAEVRMEFLDKFQKAKASAGGSAAKPIIPRQLELGNWLLTSADAGTLTITNREGNAQQKINIREDLPGFTFASGKGSTHCISAESTLGLEFVTGWAAQGRRQLKFRNELQKQRIHELAKEIWETHLREARMHPRSALVELQALGKKTNALVLDLVSCTDDADVALKLTKCLTQVRDAICDERLLSVYEICSSGIVPVMLLIVREAVEQKTSPIAKVFAEVFMTGDALQQFITFSRRAVAVAEAIENFPVNLYDAAGGSPFGLQLLARRIRLRLEQIGRTDDPRIANHTGRSMKAEPLATVGSLREHLLTMLAREWYDRPRADLEFVKQLKAMKDQGEGLVLDYESDFDTNGLIWYLGTNGRTRSKWVNPASIGLLKVSCSGGNRQPRGLPEDILSRAVEGVDCHTSDSPNANFTLDLGLWLKPSAYSLRHASGGQGRSALRNWLLQASKDNHVWEMIQAHCNDQSLAEEPLGSTATWPIALEGGQGPYRYFRVAQNGRNSGNTYVLSLAGFEIYGHVVDVVTSELKPIDSQPTGTRPLPEAKSRSRTVNQTGSTSSSTLLPSKKPSRKCGGAQSSSSSSQSSRANASSVPSALLAVPAYTPRQAKKVASSITFSSQPSNNDQSSAQLPGGANNNKLRAMRSRRSGGPGPVPLPSAPRSQRVAVSARHSTPLAVGSRVVPGRDWIWGNQNKGGTGTVIALGNGWLDVRWDTDAAVNSYRNGHCGKFDVRLASSDPTGPAPARAGMLGSVDADDDFFKSWQSPAPLQNTPVPNATSTPISGDPARSERFERLRVSLQDQVRHQRATEQSAESLTGAAELAGGECGGVTMTQKSMSTTNLMDRHLVTSTQQSVAATNQAASAESLQHNQTPSLENLLARSRIYVERIPEMSADDDAGSLGEEVPTPVCGSLDTTNIIFMGSGSQPASEGISLGPRNASSEGIIPYMENNPIGEVDAEASPELDNSTSEAVRTGEESTLEIADNPTETSLYQHSAMDAGTGGSNVYEGLNELVQAYSDILAGSAASGDDTLDGRDEHYIGDSLLRMALSDDSHSSGEQASTGESRSRATRSQQLSEMGSGLRMRLGNYAEVLRTMMQQIMSNSPSSGEDQEDLDLEALIYDHEDELIDAEAEYIESCDDDDGEGSELHSHPTYAIAERQPTMHRSSAEGSAQRCAAMSIQSKISSLASAAATLRRQLSSGAANAGNAFSSSSTRHVGASAATAAASAADGPMISWREFFMCDDGRSGRSGGTGRATARGNSTAWDDDFVLKRHFGALLPAFDPRPGRTNPNQTQEVELDDTSAVVHRGRREFSKPKGRSALASDPSLRLYLRGPSRDGSQYEMLELRNDEQNIFSYLQQLHQLAASGESRADKCRGFWETNYTLLYENTAQEGEQEVQPPVSQASSSEHRLAELDKIPIGPLKEVLDLIGYLQRYTDLDDEWKSSVPADLFHSTKFTQKLEQLLSDPLIVAASVLPKWSNHLVFNHPCLFTKETRVMHLNATAFGCSRAIVWLQNRRDQALEKSRRAPISNMAGARREDHYAEYRVGRIKHERIKVYRDEDRLLESAIKVLNFHAQRKSVLEIEYYGEEGTGLGPTLEFYALLAGEFQKKTLAMWLCDDDEEMSAPMKMETELGWMGAGKPPGYYVRRKGGLFPAYLPQPSEEVKATAELFRIFGIFIAKVIQDGRMVDIPISKTFAKLMVSPQEATPLGIDDLREINPTQAQFLDSLHMLAQRKAKILGSPEHTDAIKESLIAELKFPTGSVESSDSKCDISELGLTFSVNRPSRVFKYESAELIEDGAQIELTIDNIESYIENCLKFYFVDGIREQMAAFRAGFNSVFPLSALTAFSPEEIQTLISGDQCPQWSQDEIIKYTEPKLGYTRESPGFLHLVEVLVGMSAAERKAFLQFTTGCSSLPPGGLANLHPRLTIVQKVGSDGSYPSVNTCVHYLKLPEYSNAAVLKEKLMAATQERGFYLN